MSQLRRIKLIKNNKGRYFYVPHACRIELIRCISQSPAQNAGWGVSHLQEKKIQNMSARGGVLIDGRVLQHGEGSPFFRQKFYLDGSRGGDEASRAVFLER